MGFDGFVLVAILTLFFVYLLPSVIRTAQVSREARGEDRFSADLRIVARAGETIRPPNPHQNRTRLHRNSEAPMEPPVAHKLIAADARRIASARADRAAASSRRAAAAQRRLLLSGVLGAVSVVLWVLAFTTSVSAWVALLPTALTIGVVELGRRAAAAGRGADAKLAHAVRLAEQRSVSAAVRAATPKLNVDVDPKTLVPEPEVRTVVTSAASADESRGPAWTPVPVPPPAYTLKQAAARRLVSAIPLDDNGEVRAAEPSDTETEFMLAVPAESLNQAQLAAAKDERDEVLEGTGPSEPVTDAIEAEASSPAPSVSVQEILARRRAAG